MVPDLLSRSAPIAARGFRHVCHPSGGMLAWGANDLPRATGSR